VIRIAKMNEPSTLLSCQMINNISFLVTYGTWDVMLRSIRSAFQRNCALTMTDVENDCPETTQFRCGKKCLSKHRLIDNARDCIDNMDETYNDSCDLNDQRRMHCEFKRMVVYVERCIVRVFALNPEGELMCTEKTTYRIFQLCVIVMLNIRTLLMEQKKRMRPIVKIGCATINIQDAMTHGIV
jgi:hypothetical protein